MEQPRQTPRREQEQSATAFARYSLSLSRILQERFSSAADYIDMLLYFLRHGLAADREEWTGDDDERPLTEQGIARMKREAQTMAELGITVDALVSSPLRRAYETARIVAKALHCEDALVKDQRAGLSLDETNVRAMLADHHGNDAVMFVGHEPSMSATIGALIGGATVELKKGGLACMELHDVHDQRATLLWLVPPKLLAR